MAHQNPEEQAQRILQNFAHEWRTALEKELAANPKLLEYRAHFEISVKVNNIAEVGHIASIVTINQPNRPPVTLSALDIQDGINGH